MAIKPESRFYTSIHSLLPKDLHREKMNNPYSSGTADVWYSGRGGDLWVEYKWLPKQPKGEFRPNLSALQLKWLSERYKEGRNVAVIIGCPTGVLILTHRDWESSMTSDFPLSRRDAASWIMKETYHVTPPSGDRSKGNIPRL